MEDNIDDGFADLIAGLDAERIAMAAVEGAAHDLTAELEWALRSLREHEHDVVGDEAEQVQLEIQLAEFALRKLARMFDVLAAIDAEREDRLR
jgi:hypothetical protein